MISKAVGYAGQGVGLVGKGVSLVGKGIKGVFTGKDYRPILPIPRHEELKKYLLPHSTLTSICHQKNAGQR